MASTAAAIRRGGSGLFPFFAVRALMRLFSDKARDLRTSMCPCSTVRRGGQRNAHVVPRSELDARSTMSWVNNCVIANLECVASSPANRLVATKSEHVHRARRLYGINLRSRPTIGGPQILATERINEVLRRAWRAPSDGKNDTAARRSHKSGCPPETRMTSDALWGYDAGISPTYFRCNHKWHQSWLPHAKMLLYNMPSSRPFEGPVRQHACLLCSSFCASHLLIPSSATCFRRMPPSDSERILSFLILHALL